MVSLFILLYTVCAGNVFNPESLFVITVIDTSNSDIVRDSMTLFRSLRLFGGDFNKATFRTCIVVKENSDHNDAYMDIIRNLESLNISHKFIRSVPSNLSPTLNKFQCLKSFDYQYYDYILWLDADIFVFQSPIPYFLDALRRINANSLESPAHVHCAVEVYNYLERFPKVNESHLLWNQNLDPFTISDVTADYQLRLVPRGTCNTGVLLFSSLGIAILLENLPSYTIFDEYGYSADRFIDSLLFVFAVNAAGLMVHELDYALNYLAFVESMHLLSDDPVFAHFIGTTYFHCYPQLQNTESHLHDSSVNYIFNLPFCGDSTPSHEPVACVSCSCMYFDENREPSRNIVRKIYEVGVMEQCQKLAGLVPITQP